MEHTADQLESGYVKLAVLTSGSTIYDYELVTAEEFEELIARPMPSSETGLYWMLFEVSL